MERPHKPQGLNKFINFLINESNFTQFYYLTSTVAWYTFQLKYWYIFELIDTDVTDGIPNPYKLCYVFAPKERNRIVIVLSPRLKFILERESNRIVGNGRHELTM